MISDDPKNGSVLHYQNGKTTLGLNIKGKIVLGNKNKPHFKLNGVLSNFSFTGKVCLVDKQGIQLVLNQNVSCNIHFQGEEPTAHDCFMIYLDESCYFG